MQFTGFFFGMIVVAVGQVSADKPEKSDNEGKIEGTKWHSLKFKEGDVEVPDGVIKLVFGKDERVVFRFGDEVFEGTYRLAGGSKVVFTFNRPLDGKKIHQETIKMKDNHLILTDTDGTNIEFTKTREKALEKKR